MGVFSNGDAVVNRAAFFNGNAVGRLTSVAAAVLLTGGPVLANDSASVRAASLEVKARILSMEQVNVTAEIALDETAPAANATVAALLAQLEDLDRAPVKKQLPSEPAKPAL